MRFGSFFVATVVIGALVGWYAPGGPASAPAAPAPEVPAAKAESEDDSSSSGVACQDSEASISLPTKRSRDPPGPRIRLPGMS
jgi:hypothetical protein